MQLKKKVAIVSGLVAVEGLICFMLAISMVSAPDFFGMHWIEAVKLGDKIMVIGTWSFTIGLPVSLVALAYQED